jgi:hypothetical protein
MPKNPNPAQPDVLTGSATVEDTVWTPNRPISFTNVTGTVLLNPSGTQTVLQAGSSPATVSTQIIDFSQGENVKNKTGMSYLFGLIGQYIAKIV